MRILSMCVLGVVLATPAAAQRVAAVEVSGGYQLQQLGDRLLDTGWYADASIPVGRHLAIVVDAASSRDAYDYSVDSFLGRAQVRGSFRLYSGLGGLRLQARPHRRVTAYAQVLAGVTRSQVEIVYSLDANPSIFDPAVFPLPPLTGFSDIQTRTFATVRGGGGIQVGLTDRLGARVHVDYGGYLADASPPAGPRLTAGLVARF